MYPCHGCRAVEVDDEFTYCPACLHEWEVWLEQEWQRYTANASDEVQTFPNTREE